MSKVENIVAKGEVAHYEQFLFLPQCVLRLYVAYASVDGKGLDELNDLQGPMPIVDIMCRLVYTRNVISLKTLRFLIN